MLLYEDQLSYRYQLRLYHLSRYKGIEYYLYQDDILLYQNYLH